MAKPGLSLRGLAKLIGVEPSYLSKLERSEALLPSEKVVQDLAAALETDYDLLWTMTGRVSKSFQEALMRRPELFRRFLADSKDAPDEQLEKFSREVRDGNW